MYESVFNLTAENVKDKILYALNGASIGTDFPKLREDGKYASVTIGVPVSTRVRLTGLFLSAQSGLICYQIYFENIFGNSGYGYIWEDELNYWSTQQISTGGDVQKAQSVLNSIIAHNKHILENNLLCARVFEYCASVGVALPVDYRKGLYSLQTNLINRNTEIEKHVDSAETGESPNVSIYNSALVSFMNNPGIGFVISGTTVIIILAIVSAASAAIAYAIFKRMNQQSTVDFKYSDELTGELLKYLPADTYNKLISENEANRKIAQNAIDSASGNTILKTAKYLAVGFGGFWLIDKFLQNRNK